MRYENVQVDFWSDPDFENESLELKAIYLYYLTSPHGNLAGIYKIGDKSVKAETNISSLRKLQRLKEKLQSLDGGKVLFDEEHNLAWVVGKGKRLKGKSQIEAAKKILREDIPCCELKNKFIKKYPHLTESGQGVAPPPTGCQDSPKGGEKKGKKDTLPTGSHTVTVTVTEKEKKKIASEKDGLKETQNKNIDKIQKLFSKRFGKKLTAPQVQTLVHGGGRGRIYGFIGNYGALGMAITEMPQDVKDAIEYVFALANDGKTAEKYCKKAREESEKHPGQDPDLQKLFS